MWHERQRSLRRQCHPRQPMCLGFHYPINSLQATFVEGNSNYGSGAQHDSYGTLTVQSYSDINCNNVIAGSAYTLPVPTGIKGLPSTSCTQGTTGFTNYYFKGGYYFFDDYSKLQAAITNNFAAGTILGTYADSSCTNINTGTSTGGGLPIMVSYYNNFGTCALNVATKTSLKTTCSGPTDGTTDTSASSGSTYGALTGSITTYSDANCANVLLSTTTYTTPGYCWSSTGIGSSSIVASVGPFMNGFCQVDYNNGFLVVTHTACGILTRLSDSTYPLFLLVFFFSCS